MGSRGTETCPQCQVRFGGWYRTAKKHRTLLTNQPLWNAIRDKFLKTDNPLHPFLLNGGKKRLPTAQQSKASSNLPSSAVSTPQFMSTLLLTVGNDSNDSSCAEDAIRRECNHFRPIDGHRVADGGGLSNSAAASRQQQGRSGQRVSAIIHVPTKRTNTCGDGGGDVIGGPCGRNSFFSDPCRSAFYLVRRPHPLEQVKTVEEPEAVDITMKKRSEVNNSQKVPTNSNATTVIMLQQPKQINTHHNGLIKTKTLVEAANNNNNKVRKRIKQKREKMGEEPQRQSARRNAETQKDIVVGVVVKTTEPSRKRTAAAAAKVQVQLRADRELARELHRLLNGGATRRTTTTTTTTAALVVQKGGGAGAADRGRCDRGGKPSNDVATPLWSLRTRQRIK